MSYYAFLLMIRYGYFNHLHRARDLFHQFLVDVYAEIETERLAYIRSHQKEIKVDEYGHLRDAINNDTTHDAGKLVVLPSTFTGGSRYMHERTQDAMTYVRHYGRPDLHISFSSVMERCHLMTTARLRLQIYRRLLIPQKNSWLPFSQTYKTII